MGETSGVENGLPRMPANPSPDQRAEVIVRRLEMFIREGRTPQGGMPFKRWQDMARSELANAILESEKTWRDDNRFLNHVLVIGAAAVVTIGFWGTAVTFGGGPEHIDAALILIAGGFLLFAAAGALGIRTLWKRHLAHVREERLARVVRMDRQLKALDKDLEKRVKELEKSVEEITRIPGPRGPEKR